MKGTYDVLREAGLVPDLICRGCGKIISRDVVPWAGEGYVTHPNTRCAHAAYVKLADLAVQEGGA